MDDAEYEFLLIKNPNELEIEININDIFESYLIGGDTEIESFGLVQIGEKRNRLVYNKEQTYVTYKP